MRWLEPERRVAGQRLGNLVGLPRMARFGASALAPSKATKMPTVSVERRRITTGGVQARAEARRAARAAPAASSGSPYQAAFHWSACRATRSSMRGCLPAIRMGGPPGRIGLGRSSASSARWYRPSKVTRSPRSSGTQDLEPFVEARHAMVEREAERVELRLVPAASDAQDQPATAHLVELGRHLGGRGPDCGRTAPAPAGRSRHAL